MLAGWTRGLGTPWVTAGVCGRVGSKPSNESRRAGLCKALNGGPGLSALDSHGDLIHAILLYTRTLPLANLVDKEQGTS